MNTKKFYLYDNLTGLYNRNVVDSFINRCGDNNLIPLSILLFQIKSQNSLYDHSNLMVQFAKIFHNHQNDNNFIARFSNSKIIVFISKSSQNNAYKFAETIAKEASNLNLLDNSNVNVVFTQWEKIIPPNTSFISDFEQSLDSYKRINLSYII